MVEITSFASPIAVHYGATVSGNGVRTWVLGSIDFLGEIGIVVQYTKCGQTLRADGRNTYLPLCCTTYSVRSHGLKESGSKDGEEEYEVLHFNSEIFDERIWNGKQMS